MNKNKNNKNKLSICHKISGSIILLFFILSSFGLAFQALANENGVLDKSSSFIEQYDHWSRATDSELALQRGGFELPNGIIIDINLEKIISLNGIEAFSSNFQFPDNTFLLQNGNQNLAHDLAGSALSTIIQNNLNDQVIQTINELNIEISNLKHIGIDNSQIFNDLIVPNVH